MSQMIHLSRFQTLRMLFIFGYLIGIILTFVPSVEITQITQHGMFDAGEVTKVTYSSYGIIQLLGERQEVGLQLFFVILFALNIAFIILAIKYPKRWIFISGASITAFLLLWNFFTPSNKDIQNLFIPRIIGYISDTFILLGFLIKPPSISTSMPNLIDWFLQNKKLLVITIVPLGALFGVYYFLLRHDPEEEAKEAASNYCNCTQIYNDGIIKADKIFMDSFSSYNFKKRQYARSKLRELQNAASNSYTECISYAQAKNNELRKRYFKDEEELKKYDFAYSAQQNICNVSNQGEFNKMNMYVENKINTIEEPIPSIDKIKNNLLGQKIYTPNKYYSWSFARLDEFNNISVTSSNLSGNYLELNVYIDLEDYKTHEKYKAQTIVTYVLSGDEWIFQSVKATMYEKVGGWR